MHLVVDEIVRGVNWPLIFYVSFSAFLLIMLVRFLQDPVVELLKVLFNEFSHLAAGKISMQSLNALIIILSYALLFMLFGSNIVDDLKSIVGLTHETDDKSIYAAVASLFVILCGSLLCVFAVRKQS